MSSELYMFDNPFYSDPFSQFPDSAIDAHATFPFELFHEVEESAAAVAPPNLDEFAAALLSSSPPSAELRGLSLSQLAGAGPEVKAEECHVSFENLPTGNASFSLHETALKLMQRSHSSNSFDNSRGFSFRPQFDGVVEAQFLGSPETGFQSGQMRRVCSTGDLQVSFFRTFASPFLLY